MIACIGKGDKKGRCVYFNHDREYWVDENNTSWKVAHH